MIFVEVETVLASLLFRGQNDDRGLLLSFRFVLANPFHSLQIALPARWEFEGNIGITENVGRRRRGQRQEYLYCCCGKPERLHGASSSIAVKASLIRLIAC